MKTKILSILALLLMTVTQGAWAAADVTWEGSTLNSLNVATSNWATTFPGYVSSQTVGGITIAVVGDNSCFAHQSSWNQTFWYGSISFTAPSKIEKVVVYSDGHDASLGSWTQSGKQYTITIASPATKVTLNAPNFYDVTKLEIYYAPLFSGSGTQASPYLIASTTDWDNLSTAVNGGETYSGKYFKMTANVGTVTTMIGVCTQTEEKKFLGVFDGGGHTLTVDYATSSDDWRRTAPFPTTGAATVIKNLTVAGSIANPQRASGLVGESGGAQIQYCRVSATISGNGYTAAFAVSGGQIENCLFDGKLTGNAGFVGYRSGSGTSITNCLFKPQTGSSISQGTFYSTEGSGAATVTNSYYTSLAGGTAQGTDGSSMTAAQLVENLGASNWKVVGGNAIPKVHPGLSGEGTEDSPYLIASTTDWNNLVSAVNGGETYSGNYFKMTANVSVTTMVGNDTYRFGGSFDGGGHTLTVSYTGDEAHKAPFKSVNGATIQNLKVTGSMTGAENNYGGIVGWARDGGATITNCQCSVTISSDYDGARGHGGIVGTHQGGALSITGCVFNGTLTGTASGWGGFVGYCNGGTVSISNSLFAPAALPSSTGGSVTFVRNSGTLTTLDIDNCYYTQSAGTTQGLQAHTIAAGDYVSSLAISGDATPTYDVSGITVYSTGISFNDGSTTTFYGGSGQEVSLTLTPETRSGYQFKQYAASQGTLSDETTNTPTLTMPAANSTANDVVTISAEYDPTYNATFADGNDNDGWTISPTSGIVGSTVTVSYEGENKVKSVTVAPKGALTGKFSVSSTKQVQFSKGNLQYVGSWQFAANQYDIFGASQSDNHRDLFGWGTKTNPNNTSTTNGDYSWAEWGENTITNGCTGWRTLSSTEWNYLITGRTNAVNLRTFATVNGVTGLIIMPDGWTASGVTLTITTANYTTNVLSTSQWATLEKQGCVFLPAAGYRSGTTPNTNGTRGDYWSSTTYDADSGYDVHFDTDGVLPQNYSYRMYGISVRLVRDVE